MDVKKALDPLQKLGVQVPSRMLLLAVVLVPLLIVAGAWLWKRRSKLPKLAARVPPPTSPAISSPQLRKAWLRFRRALPARYRRSLLNFEHFVVFGEAASGKSQLIDAYTDWRRQTKQFLSSQAFDPSLQVFLGSRSVVTEIPPSVLLDLGPSCRSALRRLWRPLYRARSPTVVVVLDVTRLRDPEFDAADSAQRLRGKINLLSSIRKRPLEVRVVLTHLDDSPGYLEFAELCRAEHIPLYAPLSYGEQTAPAVRQLEVFFEHMREHLPRALVKQGSAQMRRVLSFVRTTRDLPKLLARFTDELFAHEALSLPLASGGVYLAAQPAAQPNPLGFETTPGRGPDPRRRHRVAATLMAAVLLAYLSAAFYTQRELHLSAEAALSAYNPAALGTQAERSERDAVLAFACRTGLPTQTRPDFFREARRDARQHLSDRIRGNLLIPHLRKVANDGAIRDGSLTLRSRRSLFYLALIHSDHRDRMQILSEENLPIWSEMTQLPAAMIDAYLSATDDAYSEPVAFSFPDQHDEHDAPRFWLSLLSDLSSALDAPVLSPDDLTKLRERASDGARGLARFEHDEVVRKILGQLDADTIDPSHRRESISLAQTYEPLFADFLRSIQSVDIYAQHSEALAIFHAVANARVAAPRVSLVSELADQLTALYRTPLGTQGVNARTLRVLNSEYRFDPQRWAELIRDSTASQLVAEFMSRRDSGMSVFFAADAELSFAPVRWNPNNDGTAIFVGKSAIAGPYSRASYDALVNGPTTRLQHALDAAKLPALQRRALEEFVADQVHRYAVEYKRQLRTFYDSFALSATSSESLRVAVSQMQSEKSPFNAFLQGADSQIHVAAEGAMLEPMHRALEEYGNFHDLFEGAAGADEIGKYRAILSQLLLDLTQVKNETAAADSADAAAEPTLETELSPAGRVALRNLRGDKGSYAVMIGDWLTSVALGPSQLQPFLAPVFELERLGRAEIEVTLERAWQREVASYVRRISRKFPFDAQSPVDATPRELDELLQPSTGRIASFVRRYLGTLGDAHGRGTFKLRDALEERLSLPSDLRPTLTAAAALVGHLYDAAGHPVPLSLQVATVPFEHGTDPRMGLTLVYLTIGEVSINNFNQKPGLATVRFDWTREQVSQVGVQLTNLDTQEKTFPEPIATPSSSWSALRLLAAGKASPVKKPAGGELYTWDVHYQRESSHTTKVRFIIVGNPTPLFALTPAEPALALQGALP